MRVGLVTVATAVTLAVAACVHRGPEEGVRIKVEGVTAPDSGYVGLRARCPPGQVVVEFQPASAISVRADRGLLATASLEEIFMNCPGVRQVSRHRLIIDPGDVGEPVRSRTTLVCSFPASFELSVRAVLDESGPAAELAAYDINRRVTTGGRTRVIARSLISAAVDAYGESLLLWSSSLCRPRNDG